MTKNVVGPKFWFSAHLGLWRTPKKVKNSDFSSFKLGISFLQGLLVYPRAKILLNWILDFGPRLQFMAQNVPKMAQKLKIELLRLFFSWGSHFFQYLLSFISQTKLSDRNFVLGPCSGLRSWGSSNSPKFENRTSCSSLVIELSNFQDVFIFAVWKYLWNKICQKLRFWGPIMGGGSKWLIFFCNWSFKADSIFNYV